MPLYKLNTTGDESAWGIWRISETIEELAAASFEEIPQRIIHPTKKLEWLASRVLVDMILKKNNLRYTGMYKDEYGKPLLRDLSHSISLSHSYPFVAAQLHKTKAVGIDIEHPSEKLLRIAPRVLSAEEFANAADDIRKHCVYWCAKEALYKVHGKRGLHFASQLQIAPFALADRGDLTCSISVEDEKQNVALSYQVESEFVIVYTKHN